MGQVGDDVPPLEHDPEKACPRDGHQGVYARLRGLWMDTGFRKRSCATNNVERDDDSKISHPALALARRSGSVTRIVHPHEVMLMQPPRGDGRAKGCAGPPHAFGHPVIRPAFLARNK
jgi:hypothetical protein